MFQRLSVYFIFVFCVSGITTSAAQENALTLIKHLPIEGRLMTTDDLGNIYVVKNDNTLFRYNEDGDSTGLYRSVLSGEMSSIDVRNPLMPMLFFSQLNKVVLLDRMLSRKNELDLTKTQAYGNVNVAMSADGQIWVFDAFNSRLRKVNEAYEDMIEPNDLRQQINHTIAPVQMTESDRLLYVSDSTYGLYVFDNYGSLAQQFSFVGLGKFQLLNHQIITLNGNELNIYNLQSHPEGRLNLPQDAGTILSVRILKRKLILLSDKGLFIYNTR